MTKFINAKEAVALIPDNAFLGICGFGGWLGADLIFTALKERFKTTGSPSGLRIFSGILPGNLTEDEVGMNILAEDGLIDEVYAAHFGMCPKFSKIVAENKAIAFALPLGMITNCLKAAASRKPVVISRIGLGTFCDPRVEGGALNKAAAESGITVADLFTYNDQDYLAYKVPKLDACILRVSESDIDGNLSSRKDPLTAEQIEMAMAVRAAGGIIIAQVDNVCPRGELGAKEILLHNSLVDYVVVDSEHTCAPGYDCPVWRPELSGHNVASSAAKENPEKTPLNFRKICGRRGLLELTPGSIVNLGIGLPEYVALAAAEEGMSNEILLSVESGPLGGLPVSGVGFGASVNPETIYRLSDNFDFYDGGGLDCAVLGAAEIDCFGNVNVSKFGSRVVGPGGFINIAQNTPNVCFMGSFTTGGLKAMAQNGKLLIEREGKIKKFCSRVGQITFSAETALKTNQRVLYITERAVFRLIDTGLELIEIAPGVDLEKDVLAHMEFVPAISSDLKEMDERIFLEQKMG